MNADAAKRQEIESFLLQFTNPGNRTETTDASIWPERVFVFFKPGNRNMVENCRTSRGRFHFFCSGSFEHRGVTLPGIIGIEEADGDKRATFFCIADRLLIETYSQALLRLENVDKRYEGEDVDYRSCAVEACYGVVSAFERVGSGWLRLDTLG